MSNPTLKSAPEPRPTIQQTAWLTVYGVACFAVAFVALAFALAPFVARIFG